MLSIVESFLLLGFEAIAIYSTRKEQLKAPKGL